MEERTNRQKNSEYFLYRIMLKAAGDKLDVYMREQLEAKVEQTKDKNEILKNVFERFKSYKDTENEQKKVSSTSVGYMDNGSFRSRSRNRSSSQSRRGFNNYSNHRNQTSSRSRGNSRGNTDNQRFHTYLHLVIEAIHTIEKTRDPKFPCHPWKRK